MLAFLLIIMYYKNCKESSFKFMLHAERQFIMEFFGTIVGTIQDIVKLIQNLVKQIRNEPTRWGPDDFQVLKIG